MRIPALCPTLVVLCLAGPATAHEFWLEPQDYQPSADGMLVADVVNGEGFEGDVLPYLPSRIVRYDVTLGDETRPVEMRTGDRPALNVAPLGEGLNVVAYVSTVSEVTYETYATLHRFAEHKDLLGGPEAVADLHRTRGLPVTEIVEAYTRFSKTLIGVGAGEGLDSHLGLETEIVALENPYTGAMDDGIEVQLWYDDDLRTDAQIEVYEKAPDGTVAVSTVRTDETGVAVVPVTAGHSYMLDAVILREPSAALAAETGAVWESLWANLTFAVPD